MSWVNNHRPPLVILENVCSAPWDRVKDYLKRQGYSAEFMRVDTKLFYIPHTRTRVYLFAVDKKGSNQPTEWRDWVTTKLKRPASSTLDAFLLPSDDPRIHQARQKLVQDSGSPTEPRTGRIDWTRCESRHARARLEEALGPKRPLTNWEEGKSVCLSFFFFCSCANVHYRRWMQNARFRLARLGNTTSRARLGFDGYKSLTFCKNWRRPFLQDVCVPCLSFCIF